MYPYLSQKTKYQLCDRIIPKFVDTNKFKMSLIYKEYANFLPHEPDKEGAEFFDSRYPIVDARDKYFREKFFKFRIPRKRRDAHGILRKKVEDEITDEESGDDKEMDVENSGESDDNRDYGWDPLSRVGRPFNVRMKFTKCAGRPDRLKYNETSLSLKHRSFHTILTQSAYMDSRLIILKPITDEDRKESYPHFGKKKLEGIHFGVRHLFTFVLQKNHLKNLERNSIKLIRPRNLGFVTRFKLEPDFDIRKDSFKIRGFYEPNEVKTRKELSNIRNAKFKYYGDIFDNMVRNINFFHGQYAYYFQIDIDQCDRNVVTETFSKLYHSGRDEFYQLTEEELEEIKTKQSVKCQIKELDKQLDEELETEPIEKEKIKKVKSKKRKSKYMSVQQQLERDLAELLADQDSSIKINEIKSTTEESKRIMEEFRKKEFEEQRNPVPYYLGMRHDESRLSNSSDDLDRSMDLDYLNKLIR